jgi:hypothetical protein
VDLTTATALSAVPFPQLTLAATLQTCYIFVIHLQPPELYSVTIKMKTTRYSEMLKKNTLTYTVLARSNMSFQQHPPSQHKILIKSFAFFYDFKRHRSNVHTTLNNKVHENMLGRFQVVMYDLKE